MKQFDCAQPKLSKDEVLAEYAKTGLNPLYSDLYWEKYSEIYDNLDGLEDDSDWALESARGGMEWYILYKEIGHPDSWCDEAFNFGKEGLPVEFSLKNIADCLSDIYLDHRMSDRTQANEELHRQGDYIARRFQKSPIYMRFFYEWHEGGSGGSDLLECFERMEKAYNDAISKGKKNDDFAYFYATWPGQEAWRISEMRESLIKEGRDDDYVYVYLQKYKEGVLYDGKKRRQPDIPALWELEVIAYMKGWDYARKHHLSHKFVECFQNLFLNLSYPNYTHIPVSIADETVIEEIKKRCPIETFKV